MESNIEKNRVVDLLLTSGTHKLNSKANLIDSKIIHYSHSDVIKLGGLENCIKDALSKKYIPLEGIFFKLFVCDIRYLMIGYMYDRMAYGCIILYGFENETIRYNMVNNVLTKIS